MKKMIVLALCLLLIATVAMPAFAAGPKVLFTADSQFTTGKKITVDIQAMTGMDARIYNAWLEGTVRYQWYSGDTAINGANAVSYTPASTVRSVKVQVICADLVLTSDTRIVTAASVVTTRGTMPPITWATTTKATTKATTKISTTAPTTAPTTVPTVVTTEATTAPTTPTAAPVTTPTVATSHHEGHHHATPTEALGTPYDPFTVPLEAREQDAPAPVAETTVKAPATHHEGHSHHGEAAEEPFPWWIVAAGIATAVVILGAVILLLRKKK